MNKKITKFLSFLASIIFLTLISSPVVYATPGDLDSTFGTEGKVTTSLDTFYGSVLAVQSDGKIIAAGHAAFDFALVRYNPNGNLDTTFGNNGQVVTNISVSDTFFAVGIQSDGKIIAAGEAEINGARDFALVRYNPDGSLDTSFGNEGKITTDFFGLHDFAYDLVIQADGKIVVAGAAYINENTRRFALARYNTNGSLDTTFGNGGKVTTFIGGFSDIVNAVTIQPDNKIVAVGSSVSAGTNHDFGIVRYNPDGSLDTTFDTDGKVKMDFFNNSPDVAGDVLIQPGDDKIVVLGNTATENMNKLALARYNPDGSLDASFDVDGIITIDFGNTSNYSTELVMQPDGKLVIAGSVFIDGGNGESRFALARHNPDGSLDPGFGNGGKITTSFMTTPARTILEALILQPDGKLVAGGNTNNLDGSNRSFVLARYEGGEPNFTPTANAGVDQTGSEETSILFDGSASTDPDGSGDIASYIWDFGDGTTGTGQIINHTYADNGVYTITLTVTDSAGATSTDTAIVTINNVAPMVGEITAPLDPQQIGTAINVNANFTDPGVIDTHSAVWDFGDGTTSTGTITEANGNGSVIGNHTYVAAGVYTLTLTVTDKDGGSGQNIFQYIVVYDPNGGFVTGGGWINSPAGAYAIVPSLSDKANFGFVSKYQNGANIPTGNTKFVFSVADFSFQSTSYDWLVVSGPKAQYKGSGSINGTGDYGFILTTNDGQINGGGGTDKFRLKVWDKATGGVIYDNQIGEDDNADVSTTLGGGSIVIHN